MQVALIAALCCVVIPTWSVVVVVVVLACYCCIPYRLALMLAATFAPCVLTFAPYILILCLWCVPSFKWCKHSTCTDGGCHQLQLAPVVLFHSATGANTALALGQLTLCGGGRWWWHIVACGGGLFNYLFI